MSYIKWEDIVTSDFMRSPNAVVLEAGNGFGKTQSMCDFATYSQKLNIFDRIYFFQYSHRGCENVINKISSLGGWSVWYVGMEKFCPRYSQFTHFINMGIPPSYFCYLCQHFKSKSKIAYRVLQNQLSSSNKSVIMPSIITSTPIISTKVCTYPLIKALTIDPAYDSKLKQSTNETPIFVVPSQLFFQHSLVLLWREFVKRQRKSRKTLFIVDEADTVFYSSIRMEIPEVMPTKDDYSIMKTFSSKTRRLVKVLDVYPDILRLLENTYKKRGVMIDDIASELVKIVNSVEKEVRSFRNKRKKIIDYVVSNNVQTNIFRIVHTIEALLSLHDMKYALKTIEKEKHTYILENYEYGVELLLSTDFPWKYIWKILLTATFPSKKILSSRILSPRSKAVLNRARYYTKSYSNVFVTSVQVFDKMEYSFLNRNKEIVNKVPKVLGIIKHVVNFYKRVFCRDCKGVLVWFGNSTQYRNFFNILRGKLQLNFGRKYTILKVQGIKCFFSFVGSEVSRGIDFREYDISIVLGPLLRPPRNIGFLDVIDFGRAIAEGVQSAMRIVRSPRPKVPKLIVVEESMLTPFYQEFYPSWFIELLNTKYLDLLPKENTTHII